VLTPTRELLRYAKRIGHLWPVPELQFAMAGKSGADSDTRIIVRRQKKWLHLNGARVAVCEGWEFRCRCDTRFIAPRQKKWRHGPI
jgi:hypothetical protein